MTAKNVKVPKINTTAWWSVARRLKDYIRPERTLVITSLLALLMTTGMRLLKPLPLAFVFDHVLIESLDPSDVLKESTKEFETNLHYGLFDSLLVQLTQEQILIGCGIAVVIVALMTSACSFFSTVGLALAGSRILSSIRNDLFEHIQYLSLRFHSQAKAGDLTMRLINDIGMLREAVITALMPMLANILILLGMTGMMFYLDWNLTLLAILSFPVLWWTTNRTGEKIHQASREQRKQEGSLAAKAAEYISSIRIVQSLSLEDATLQSFAGNNTDARKKDVKTKRLAAGLERRVDILVAFVTAIVLFMGARSVLHGEMTPGELLIFMSYLNNSFRPVREYAKYTTRLSKALAAGERIVDLLDEEPDIQDKPNAPKLKHVKGEVRFEHVFFSHQNKENLAQPVLKDMNFTIKPGQSVAIVGPSGAGKSTITSLLLRLYDPDEGAVRIDGKDIRDYKISSVRSQIAIVPQDNILFGVSIRRNIALGAHNNKDEVTDEQIIAAAKLAQAHDFIMAMPEGYDTVLSERGSSLSGGQRQRIAIARAAVNNNSILILDEPTVGLDQESENAVIKALDNLTHGRTTIIITHDLNFATKADRIIFVDNGAVKEQGSHQKLLAKGGKYAAWWKLQNG
ncbi:ABC transporter ATP-binding protein [Actinobacillus vicugnae]|uniref:ABC transporter ATP-binding protein n=1 Tax=Actinobacillus vicugnae TaxID=2573093 RepID=UPI001241237F|nr:ABC transporter ATP-binding protein [Actinobacillus vicugnae]